MARWRFRFCFLVALTAHLAFPAIAATSERSGPRSFHAFVASIWPLAKQRGVSKETFSKAFAGVSFDWRVLAYTEKQPEFALSIGQYIANAVSRDRVERGRVKASAVKPWLDKARETYGVDEGPIVGIWGLETDFGRYPGGFGIIRSLASLAYVRFRGDYFRDELLSALVILQAGDIAPKQMRGSWAGAMGQTQFMPSSFLAYAVDFEGHGRRDIWSSEPDAIGSTANYLAAHGWKPHLPWGFEVDLPPDFALTDADSSRPAPFSAFGARGVRRPGGEPLPASGEARLFMPAGIKGPTFLVTDNFDVIKTYNASTSYALAVALLGDQATGGATLVANWPAADRPLAESEVRRLQASLKKMGYNVGEIDGMIGDGLRSAIRAYQERNGISPDGYADLALLKRIDAAK